MVRTPHPCPTHPPPPSLQVEVDFKAECTSGQVIESLAQRIPPPEAIASNGAGPDCLAFVHSIRRCQGGDCTELVRCRTTWRAGEQLGLPS